MENVTDKVKELLMPEKTKPKLSPLKKKERKNNLTNASHIEQTENK